MFKKEKDGAMVRRFLALVLLHERQNAEERDFHREGLTLVRPRPTPAKGDPTKQ